MEGFVRDIALVERKNLRLKAIKRRLQVSSSSSTRRTNMHQLKTFPYTELPRGQTSPVLSPALNAYSVRPAAIQRCAGLNTGSGTYDRPKSSLSVCWRCKERLLLQRLTFTGNLLSTTEVPVKIPCFVTYVLPADAKVRDNSCGVALGY